MTTMTQIQVVEAFATTTLTKTAFAAEHGISTRTLGRWVEKFNGVTANDAEEVIEVLTATADPVVVVEDTPVVETNDAIVVPVVEEVIETPVVVEEKTNKRALAAAAYFGNVGMKRKDLIAMMVATCGLTAAGASTYISNFKTGKWTA
ncbi:hypothetical protein AHP1_661 [Aeromonas phage Ahp1_CNU-2021]|nr:hypothetical protein AHP1_661 [Aeromonas phage Ahp1_CNU-2021]